jgi:hypothetical protein
MGSQYFDNGRSMLFNGYFASFCILTGGIPWLQTES